MSNYGYYRPGLPFVVKNLIIINAIVFVVTMFAQQFMYQTFSLFYFTSPLFKPFQLITYMFMHGGFWHIFFNMYTLFIFGTVLERVWGTKKFLIFYFVTGLGAALLHMTVQFVEAQMYISQIAENSQQAMMAYQTLKMTPTVGASGAIYGVLIGYAMLFPDSVLTLIFPPVSLKAKWFVIIFAVIELFTGIQSISSVGGGIAHFAHLGGMLFGWLLILYWKKKNRMY